MKVVTPDGKFWTEVDEDVVKVGMTDMYIEKLGILWAFIPREIADVQEGQPFANIESSKKLGTLRSPIKGTILDWPAGGIHPELFTTDTVLFTAKVK